MRKYILIPFKQYQDSQQNKTLPHEQSNVTPNTLPPVSEQSLEGSKTAEHREVSTTGLPGSKALPITPKKKGVSSVEKKQKILERKRKRTLEQTDLQHSTGESQPDHSPPPPPPLRKTRPDNVINPSTLNPKARGSRKFWLSV